MPDITRTATMVRVVPTIFQIDPDQWPILRQWLEDSGIRYELLHTHKALTQSMISALQDAMSEKAFGRLLVMLEGKVEFVHLPDITEADRFAQRWLSDSD